MARNRRPMSIDEAFGLRVPLSRKAAYWRDWHHFDPGVRGKVARAWTKRRNKSGRVAGYVTRSGRRVEGYSRGSGSLSMRHVTSRHRRSR